jgi:hypothetical protein
VNAGGAAVSVACVSEGDGWSCAVTVAEGGGKSSHSVSVSRAEMEELAPGMSDPQALVEESFRFLLEREPKESILGRFALSDIERYFPEYGREITVRLGRYGTHDR